MPRHVIPLQPDGTFKQPDATFDGIPIYYEPVFDLLDDQGKKHSLLISDPQVVDLERYPLKPGEKLLERILRRCMQYPAYYAQLVE